MFKKKFILLYIICFSLFFIVITSLLNNSKYPIINRNNFRVFKSAVEARNIAEEVVLNYLNTKITDDFDMLLNLMEDKNNISKEISILKDNYSNGSYTKKIIVNSMESISDSDLLNKYPDSTHIIKVNYDKKLPYNQNSTAQFGSGNYNRVFVIKSSNDNTAEIIKILGHMNEI